MNEILQQRIEEKSKELGQIFFPDNMNVFARPNWEAGYIETACKEIANFTLQKQRISVEEALPKKDEDGSDTSIYVLITDSTNPFGYIWKAYFDFTIKDWYDAMSCEILPNITHWMEIPSLKGDK